ncbi:hypothetical protein EC973_004962 [Apophysomyces ossiformis]|uniref:RING-type domain-containing protein n=1 Tax=Apophysomyces ossiformis TaxID=679940 RepID=A0A8H7BJZ1_9FUNG|nr:hypothetical protein EC973_004962 [Apophysomyces ossiformis]
MQIRTSGDYAINMTDADANFDWDDIEQVLISAAKTPTCPVCLSTPAAARVAKCGHVFCLPCILHHIAVGDDPKAQWRDCPICGDMIYEYDLKSTRLLPSAATSRWDEEGPLEEVLVGDLIDMCLVQRTGHALIALPLSKKRTGSTFHHPTTETAATASTGDSHHNRDHHHHSSGTTSNIPWTSTPSALNFARFMFPSPGYMDGEYNRDLQELDQALEEAKQWNATEELTYIYDSIQLVKDKQKEAVAHHEENDEHNNNNRVRGQFLPGASAAMTKGKLALKHVLVDEHNHHHDVKEQQEASSLLENNYYYYQAADGRNIYLQPLDIKILKHEFGSYEAFPSHLQAIITGVEETAFTEDLRKRHRYLSHVPLTCDVTFIEIDLSGIVSKETLEFFDDELKARMERRKEEDEKDKEEEEGTELAVKESLVSEDTDHGYTFGSSHETWDDDEEEMLQHVLRLSAAEHQEQMERDNSMLLTAVVEEQDRDIHETYDTYDTYGYDDDDDGYAEQDVWDHNLTRRRRKA